MHNSEITTSAVRLALGMHHLRAEHASRNIASSNVPGAKSARLDFAQAERLLEDVAGAGSSDRSYVAQRLAQFQIDGATSDASKDQSIQIDEEIADMTGASLAYQTLTQSLSRYFGLMRLAATGRS